MFGSSGPVVLQNQPEMKNRPCPTKKICHREKSHPNHRFWQMFWIVQDQGSIPKNTGIPHDSVLNQFCSSLSLACSCHQSCDVNTLGRLWPPFPASRQGLFFCNDPCHVRKHHLHLAWKRHRSAHQLKFQINNLFWPLEKMPSLFIPIAATASMIRYVYCISV